MIYLVPILSTKMYKSSKKYFYLVIILFVVCMEVTGEFLIRKGWYKTNKSNKGPRVSINNVHYIDADVVPDSTFLKINGRIPTIFGGGIRNLKSVTTLKLSFCGIREIKPGGFVNLTHLETLSLSDNELDTIRYGVFNNLPVFTLFLHRNEIRTIESRAFDDMPNLYRIKLNSNLLTYWDSNWFKNTPRITDLFFRRNEILKIPGRAFRNLKGGHSYNGTYTVDTKIYLSHNNISFIDPHAFEGLEEFNQLYLDRNRLAEIDDRVFSHLKQIGVIFLSKNQLTSLPANMFPNINADLLTLDLAANNNLSCISYEIITKVKMTVLQDVRKLDCKCILQLMERLVNENKRNEIKTDCQYSDME